MKNLLLINPPQKQTIAGNLPHWFDESRGNIPPLGLLYVASAVEAKTPWKAQICDMSAGDHLNGQQPDVVGITATTFTILDALEVARQVKEKWNVPVALGGMHPTIFPEETRRLKNIDTVVIGEAENAFPQYIDYIALKGVSVVSGEVIDITTIPIPARHLIDKEKYYSVIGKNKYLTSMFTSRGCPYQCTFCHRKTMGKNYRALTADRVVEEIKEIRNMGISEVLVYDDTFTVDRKRVVAVCQKIIEERIKIDFDIRARVNHVDKELLILLKQAGCKRIHFGVEASSDRILSILKKGITIEEVRKAFYLCKQVGIETLAYFMIGNPGETTKDVLQTIEFAKELKPDYCHFSALTPYPDTPLYIDGLQKGLYDDYWLEFAKNPTNKFEVPFWTEIEKPVLQELLQKAYRSFYTRPSFVAKEILKTRSAKKFFKKAKSAAKIVLGGS